MHRIGDLARKFKISRSTLLYYDSINLLKPSGRSASNYRLYSDHDVEKMRRIALYREAGISLKSIGSILEKEANDSVPILESRLLEINREIQSLRTQQTVILEILQTSKASRDARIMTEQKWISLLKSMGLDEASLMQFHTAFERMSPEAHQDFLESLGMQEREISAIREMAKAPGAAQS